MSLNHLIEDAARVLADLDEARERLHSVSETGDTRPGVSLGGLGGTIASGSDTARIHLASLPGPAHRRWLEKFRDAGAGRREELALSDRSTLFSIVFALYRPGPAFGAGHTLVSNALNARITPGGKSWREFFEELTRSQQGQPWVAEWDALAACARHCVRLDHHDGTQAGSGFLLGEGSVLTARHVVEHPGWLFGAPPDATALPGWVRFNRINGADAGAEARIAATGCLLPVTAAPDISLITQADGWRDAIVASPLAGEFGGLAGLPLQSEPIAEDGLRRRAVVVIGHPLRGNAGGDLADLPIVFGDAPLGTKRFMPGFLDATEPLVVEHGHTFLSHDCSTLGGASGTCLIDLTTGRVLGIHVAGLADTGNRAVPSWTAAGELPGLAPPHL